MKFLQIACQNQENLENLIIQRPNYENHEIIRISLHIHKNNENSIIHLRI